jgi:hypothetical protein
MIILLKQPGLTSCGKPFGLLAVTFRRTLRAKAFVELAQDALFFRRY